MAETYPDSQIARARSTRQQSWLEHLRVSQAHGTYAAFNAAKTVISVSAAGNRKNLWVKPILGAGTPEILRQRCTRGYVALESLCVDGSE